MHRAPKCLSRRYDILDNLVKDLTASMSEKDYFSTYADDVPMKMVYDLWNMIKNNPPCEGCPPINQNTRPFSTGAFKECNYQVYSGQVPYCPQKCDPDSKETIPPQVCECDSSTDATDTTETVTKADALGASNAAAPSETGESTTDAIEPSEPDESAALKEESGPRKALALIKSMVASQVPDVMSIAHKLSEDLGRMGTSSDNETNLKVSALIEEQKELVQQIRHLESREKAGIKLLQEADDLWTRMENVYKAKVNEAMQRQNSLKKQHLEAVNSTKKWKNMKKDLESQIETIDRTLKDMNDKYRHKGNDLRTIDGQISNIEKRIDSSKREIEMTEKAILSKKKNSDYIAENYASKIDKIAEDMTQETRSRAGRERDDVSGINKARDELQNVWQQLLQKKLNNEYLRVQKENIISDIASMKKSEIDCKQRCYIKKETLANEINRFDLDIAKFKIQCSRCNKSVDTRDVWNVCSDCPRCIKEQECSTVGEACGLDGAQCICVAVKQKFMDNVFENMNAVLQKQIEVGAGKAVGEVVLSCLKHSKNGKVDTETKRLLKEFILTTVRKHLNLTIVGGAVKTRCELDPEAYNKLMLCLKDATVETIGKEDKTTNKKSPCKRWKGTFECHCPKGPKNCACPQKAPQLTNDPTVYSMFQGKSAKRPYKNGGFCGPERRKEEYYIGKPVAERSEPCKGSTSAAWNVQDVTKVTPLAINESTTSQEQRSSGTSQYGSCKDSDLEKRTQYLKVRSRNEDCKRSNPHLLKPLNHKAKLNEPFKPPQPVRQSCVSREVPNKCSRRRDHYLRMPERLPPSACYINNKKWLCNNGQHLETPRGPKRQKHINITCDDIIELIDTPSGSPAMAFNKSIIKLIDSKLNGRKTMQVYLRRIGRHRFVLRTSKDNLYGKGYEVATVRKTGSRNLYMDVPKNIIQSTASYTITKTARHNNSNDSIENNNLCEAVKLCVKTENGELAFVDGVMTTPTSNRIKVDLQNVPNLKDFFNKKVPVVELQTKSGTCKLDITSIAVKRQTDKASVDSSCSAHFLKKRGNSSRSKSKRNEAFLQNLTKKMQYEQDYFSDHTMTSKNNNVDLIEVKPCTVNTVTVKRNAKLKSDQGFTKHRNYIKSKNGLKDERYKLSVKGIISNEIFEPPAVLRQTFSNNYVLEIDKEYEKDCRNEISKHVLKKYVKILKSPSKHCMHIDVNSKDQDPNKKDGRLLNTLSGNLKLMVINRDATDRDKEADKDYKVNKSNKIHVAFKNILCKVFSTNTVQKIKSMTFTEASSDSFLKRKYGANTIFGDHLFSKLSSSVKKTTSGAYDLILDKHSKQKFIKNIENLVKKSRGVLPISTKAGEIKIQLNKLGKPKDKEYLRLTASGNIFLLINEKTLEELNNDEDLDEIDKRIFEKSVKNLCVAENESLSNESISNCKGSSIDSDSSILVKKSSSYLLDQLYPNTHVNDNISCHQENKSCGIGAQEYQEWFTSVDPCFYYENECDSASYALQRNLSRLDKEIKVLHSTINFKESGVMEYS